jgi:hypothetical protein
MRFARMEEDPTEKATGENFLRTKPETAEDDDDEDDRDLMVDI